MLGQGELREAVVSMQGVTYNPWHPLQTVSQGRVECMWVRRTRCLAQAKAEGDGEQNGVEEKPCNVTATHVNMHACAQDETILAQAELKEAVGRVGSDVDDTRARVSEVTRAYAPLWSPRCRLLRDV